MSGTITPLLITVYGPSHHSDSLLFFGYYDSSLNEESCWVKSQQESRDGDNDVEGVESKTCGSSIIKLICKNRLASGNQRNDNVPR
jgi:hypothetical protein